MKPFSVIVTRLCSDIPMRTTTAVRRLATGAGPNKQQDAWSQWTTYAASANKQASQYLAENQWARYTAGGVAVAGVGYWLFGGKKRSRDAAHGEDHQDAQSLTEKQFAKYSKSLDDTSSQTAKGSSGGSKGAAKQAEDPPMRDRMAAFVREMQAKIVNALDEVEAKAAKDAGLKPKQFVRDEWVRKEGGFGLSCVLQEGNVFEKGGVLVSVVHGPASENLLKQMRARKKEGLSDDGSAYEMFAAGCSMVLHPHNPNAPTAHLNYRYFELVKKGEAKPVAAWFGGGCDLTPSYLYEEDASHFHKVIKDVCDKHDGSYYPKFKKWCDDYFVIAHRGESRGVGGIFFDDLEEGDHNKLFAFVKECGLSFVDQYVPIIKRRWNQPFSQEMKDWQQLRRGRYVEFNLVYDRGTKFGLATPGARIESIMCSLPLTARWEYMNEPKQGSREMELVQVLKSPRQWA